jgi:hypothetical protein
MEEKWEQLGFSSKEKFESLSLLTEQRLFAKKFFGDQINHESRSELGVWLKSHVPENIIYKNMERSVDCWFRIGDKDNLYSSSYMDLKINYNHENPEQSYIGVSVINLANLKDKNSEMFFFSKDDFEKMKDFILKHANIFN